MTGYSSIAGVTDLIKHRGVNLAASAQRCLIDGGRALPPEVPLKQAEGEGHLRKQHDTRRLAWDCICPTTKSGLFRLPTNIAAGGPSCSVTDQA